MQTIPLRDIDGYVIPPENKPRADRRRLSGGYTVVRYIYCPESNGLKHIAECQMCKKYAGIKSGGLNCRSREPYNPPEYCNK